MPRKACNIIKAQQVYLAGPCVLGATAEDLSRGPQARIVAQQDGTATLEVMCSCGQRIYLQCETGGLTSPAAPAGKTPARTGPAEQSPPPGNDANTAARMAPRSGAQALAGAAGGPQ